MNPVQSDAALAYLEDLSKDIKSLVKQQEIANILTLASNPNVPENIRRQCLETAMMDMGLMLRSDYISDDLGPVIK